jgi:hypothetical protein
MCELPLGPDSRVLIIGDPELEKATAAVLAERFGCRPEVQAPGSGPLPEGHFNLVVVNHRGTVVLPGPERVRFLMRRNYGGENLFDYDKVIWEEDLWVLQERGPDLPEEKIPTVPPITNYPQPMSLSDPPGEEAEDDPSSAIDAAENSNDSCPGCGFVPPSEVNYARSMGMHKRQCEKFKEMRENAEH